MARRITNDDTFRRLSRARDLLAAGYNERVTLDQAAKEACLSPFHFQRMFTRTFGQSPQNFLTSRRMETAKQLLAGDLPVTEVCLEVGYSSMGTFSSRFAALFGHPPSEYRRQVKRWIAPVHGWRVHHMPSCFLEYWLGRLPKPQD